jgi:Rrf2 family protein
MLTMVSTRVYYALKCLVCLAESGVPRKAKELAEATGIPPCETAKILYQLDWAGLISSRRGSNGGSWLRRPATGIHVRDVLAFFQPADEADSRSAADPIFRVLQKQGGTLNPRFEKLSLAELARESRKGLAASQAAARRKIAFDRPSESHKRTTGRRQSSGGDTRAREHIMTKSILLSAALVLILAGRSYSLTPSVSQTLADARTAETANAPEPSLTWQSPAKLRGTLGKSWGTLFLSDSGVEFQSEKGASLHWPFIEIQTLDLGRRRVVITGYERRGRFRPGTRRFRFDLKTDLPPQVAAEVVSRIGRPVLNGVPEPGAPDFAEIPAHHRTAFGGTISNGVLRFGEEGIEYISKGGKDSRNWRWTEIRTLSNPDSYRLILFGYRDTYTFDLKAPLTRQLFDHLSDQIFLHSTDGSGSGEVGR